MKLSKLAFAACCMVAGFSSSGVVAKADPNKVLHVTFEAADDGFDLMRTNSMYSTWAARNIFENLLTYDYLARPLKLKPMLAEAMPEITEGGKVFTVRIKKGIYFTPDPAFNGQRRELVAQDFIYTIQRVMDPVNRSTQSGDFEDKIEGLDEQVALAKKTGKFDYNAPIAGLKALDRYTLQYRLKRPDYTFLYLMADGASAPVAREVVEKYGLESGRHPIGTGPYILKEYVPRSKIVFEANPDYRSTVWDLQAGSDAWDQQIVADMKGKSLPQIGRVEVSIIEENQGRWLAFASGQSDFDLLPEIVVPKVLDGDKLKPDLAKRGVRLYRFIESGSMSTFFNFRDPVVGGYSKEKIALRRAIAMAYDVQAVITQAYFGQGVKAEMDVPPSVAGHVPAYHNSIRHNPELAKKLLDKFGYRVGADGFRTLPDGKPLVIKIHSAPQVRDKTKMEVWRKALNGIGLRAEFPIAGFADNLQAAYKCKLPMFGLGNTAAIPDGSDFMTTYYGPNAERGNFGCYQSKVFDDAFAKARTVPPGSPEHLQLYRTMTRQLEADTARVVELWRYRNWVIQPWVKGYKKHPILHADWMYLDVDKR
ncbi:MAG: hypothetical protein RL748_3025 [Pseudomonadota bacterium]